MPLAAPSTVQIRVGHSPDPDDAFMFHALANDKIDTGRYRFTHELQDIETLNRRAFRGELELTAVSLHGYAYVTDKYALCACGASMGDNYGPMVVARQPGSIAGLKGKKIAVPGTLTTAFLTLRLYKPDVDYVVMPFDRIQDAVRKGDVAAGLLIHEGQLTYQDEGLKKIVDLGEWWTEKTGLPLPLGGNVIRRDLGPDVIMKVSRLLHESIAYALAHREEALDYALQFGRGLDRAKADRFVGMYVNDLTLEYGERGRAAVQRLMSEAWDKRLIPKQVVVEYSS